MQTLFDNEQRYTVANYLRLINETLGLIPSERICIVGEVSDHRVSQGKWINFDLKDEEEEAKISCFATTFKLRLPLEDGMKIRVVGYPKVYERFGKFSLNVEQAECVGEGALAKAYALLKKKLQEEGLFNVSRKRDLPRFPSRIGLITSTEAAAYGDFLRILNNRWGGVEVMHTPVHVQGQHAVREILEAFAQFEALAEGDRPEILVLTRGGGSLEDLHAFNDEQVARAVFQSSIPVVCGVGHERDESLCDFVADIRASTPSNAAERVVPDRQELQREIHMETRRMEDVLRMHVERRMRAVDHSLRVLDRFIERKLQSLRVTLERFHHAFDRFRMSLIATRQYIERNERSIERTFFHVLQRTRQATESLVRLFESFHVGRVLERGFSIARAGGKIVRDAVKLAPGDVVEIQFARGNASTRVANEQKKLL